ARRERPVHPVVEGQVGLVVPAHGAATGGIGGVDVGLGEAVHGAVVVLRVAAVPGVVEVGDLAVGRLVEVADGRRVGVEGVGVGGVGRLALHLGLALAVQLAQVVIRRPVLLHH